MIEETTTYVLKKEKNLGVGGSTRLPITVADLIEMVTELQEIGVPGDTQLVALVETYGDFPVGVLITLQVSVSNTNEETP